MTPAQSPPTSRYESPRRRLVVLATVVAAIVLLPQLGRTHIIREEPWHPVPAAYLRGLFYLKLAPVDWNLVAEEFDGIREEGSSLDSVYEGFALASSLYDVDPVAAVRRAVAAQDAAAVASETTRTMSQLTRLHLHRGLAALDTPGEALESVHQASRMYRAFERFIRATDPTGARDLGRAWLELTTTVGTAGVEQRGVQAADRERFADAVATVDEYLVANYEGEGGPALTGFDPVPAAGRAAADRVVPWLPPGSDINDQDPLPRLVLNFEERGVDEKDLFLVAYGDMLFDSPQIFGDPARSLTLTCSRCHNRSDINQRFFIPGISNRPGGADVDGHFFNPRFNDRRADALDTPSLRGIRFTAPYGRDGRVAGLRDFTRNVIVNEFAGAEPTPLMLDALVAYMLEFDWLPSPHLAPDGRLNDTASPSAQRGQVLFNREFSGLGDRACSTCHVPSNNFVDGQRHDIGTGQRSSPSARDSFFDTPTLIGALHTAPYFHDGALATLGEVVTWFDTEFGLGLDATQKSDLTAYLEHVGTGENPYEVFDEDNTQFQLFWGELSTFASTLSTLIPARDAEHADLMLRTVVADLRLDVSALQDLSQAPKVFELADQLEAIQVAIAAGDWDRAADLYDVYQALEIAYEPDFR
jgi:hypothetical protein